MRAVVIILFMIYIGCSNGVEQIHKVPKGIDTAQYVLLCKELILFKQEIKIINNKLHLSDSVNTVLSVLVLDYQKQIIAAKFDKIELITIKKRFARVVSEYNSVFKNLEEAAIENSLLTSANQKAFETITVYKNKNEELEKEKQNMKDRIKLIPSGVTIQAFKKIKKPFRKERIDTTTVAKKVEYVEISFNIPNGIPVDYRYYKIEVKLYAAVGVKGIVKGEKILYNGNEWQHTFTFNKSDVVDDFRSGRHEAEILIDAKTVYNGTFNLK